MKKAGLIGDVNGKLTDDLNKNFLSNGYAKILKLTAPAPKKYSLSYMLLDGSIKEKTKCNGIDQRNMKFINPLTGSETTKMTYDIFEHMYISFFTKCRY